MTDRRRFGPWRRAFLRLLQWFLVAWCLLVWLNPAGAGLPQLGEPPVLPKSPVGLATPEAELQPLLEAGLPGVNPQSRGASRLFFYANYLAADSPIDWTGNRATCNAGDTALSFRNAVLLRLNYFRAMAGVPANVTFSDTYSSKDQQAALMMSVNNALNHYPPDSWLCYTAAGYEAAGNSNIALGADGRGVIDLYIQDPGTGNGFVGHRRWILYPPTQTMGTGDLPATGGQAANALWMFDSSTWGPRPATREEYVAWPPPGYVPYQVVYPRWSFSYPGANFSAATVSITRMGASVPVTLEPLADGYGDNTIVWIFQGMSSWDHWPKPTADATYTVMVQNVQISGTPRSFTYNVTVFDPATITGKSGVPSWLLFLLGD